MTNGSQDQLQQPDDVQHPASGPLAGVSECPPRLPPPEENSPSARLARGFASRPDLRYRAGQPKHRNFRIAPKESGWKPYHPRALLSATDVMAIRMAPMVARELAAHYGVGVGTIRDIRAGRRGHFASRPRTEKPNDRLSPTELAGQMLKDLAALSKWYRAAMRRARTWS